MPEVRSRLTKDVEKQLCQLLGSARLCLVYKGSDHGFTPQVFHHKCDAQGSTLVVGYNNSGYIFGGFSSEGFRSRQVFVKDDNAFLFGINTKNALPHPMKIPVKNADAAIYDLSQYGPSFGNSSLQFLTNGLQVVSNATNDYEYKTFDLFGDDRTLVEIEVYRVEGVGNNMDSPWRKISWAVETYAIKDAKSGKSLSLILCDSMGLEEKSGTGLDVEDIPKILDGHVPDRYQFNPTASIQPSASRYLSSPSLEDKIHCVVFVLDACKVGILSEKMEEKLRQLRIKIKQQDVPHLVLLTKVDELCPTVAEDIENVYTSRAVEKQIHTAAVCLGITVSCVLPVKNYSYELELDDETDILTLHAVQQILRMADLYFDDMPVEKEENNKRKDV
ncbi:interferon-induced protein 44-like [Lissotriton helveticus]